MWLLNFISASHSKQHGRKQQLAWSLLGLDLGVWGGESTHLFSKCVSAFQATNDRGRKH